MTFSIKIAFTDRKTCDDDDISLCLMQLSNNSSSSLINFIYIYEHRCNAFNSDFVPLAFETYGETSERFEKLIERLSSKAAEFNNIPYPILLNYWKKRISTTLQIGNVSIISEAYRRLFNFGAKTIQRDFDVERTIH